MNVKYMIFLLACGIILSNQALVSAQEETIKKQETKKSIDVVKKKLLNDWLNKITKKIDAKKINFETGKSKEITPIIGLRGWELRVKRFDLPNWLGEIVTSKDKFLLGINYAKEGKIKLAILIFESFIKNFPDSKAKIEAEKAIEVLKELQ
jgi:TolA-binding protein